VAREFSQLPFDHLLFTGSTSVGRQVMRAAAENLTPVTLELGGKSPAIIGPGAGPSKDFRARRRAHHDRQVPQRRTDLHRSRLCAAAGRTGAGIHRSGTRVVAACYPDIEKTADYSTIVDQRQYARLSAYLEEARMAGAKIVDLAAAAVADPLRRRLPPVCCSDAGDELRVMQEEIFGPLLPLRPYRDLDEAIAFVNGRPRPLALYYFDSDRAAIERILDETVSGGVTINDTILHIAQDDLPFGGVGPSGMGCYHGFAGFETFSVRKGVFRQSRLSGIGLFKPPYGACSSA
jgi:coniferyl-aldehyde dehydrogenase